MVQEAWPGRPLHIVPAEGVGIWVTLAAVLEVVCEEDVSVLEVTLLGEQCTIVWLLHRAPQVLSVAQVQSGDREEVAAGLLVRVILGLVV